MKEDPGVPLDEIFTNREMRYLEYEKWRFQRSPEDISISVESREEWGRIMNREEIAKPMRRKTTSPQ